MRHKSSGTTTKKPLWESVAAAADLAAEALGRPRAEIVYDRPAKLSLVPGVGLLLAGDSKVFVSLPTMGAYLRCPRLKLQGRPKRSSARRRLEFFFLFVWRSFHLGERRRPRRSTLRPSPLKCDTNRFEIIPIHDHSRMHFLLDGVLRNFDLGKVPLCLFVRGKLGDQPVAAR